MSRRGGQLRELASFEMPLDWQTDAACRNAGHDVSDTMTSATRDADVRDLVKTWCTPCPVKDACLADGRATHASGLYGGVVLDAGRRAALVQPDRRSEVEPPTTAPAQRTA